MENHTLRIMNIVNPALNLDWLQENCTGRGTVVAVVDSGVDATHPDLQGKVSRACVVQKAANGDITFSEQPGNKSSDSYGHGTAVAGVILSLAPCAQIVSVKVLNEYNRCTGQELIAGLKWALDQNIKLINMSLATAKNSLFPNSWNCASRQTTRIRSSLRETQFRPPWLASDLLLSYQRRPRGLSDKFFIRYYPKSIIDFGQQDVISVCHP